MFPGCGICYAVGRSLCLCDATYTVVVQTRSRYPRKAEAAQRKNVQKILKGLYRHQRSVRLSL